MKDGETLSILLLNEAGSWTAQCIEYDLAGQGKTSDDALYDLQRVFCVFEMASREEGIENAWEALPPAPEFYRKRFKGGPSVDVTPPRIQCDVEETAHRHALAQNAEVRLGS